MSIAMFALAGFLVGGAYTLVKNGASKVVAGLVAALALLAVAAGVAWL